MAAETKKDIAKVVEALKANRFDCVEFVSEADTANALILTMIPIDATVGIGGSVTVRQIGLLAKLKQRGTTVIDYAEPSDVPFDDLLRKTLCTDILITSSNAVTKDGRLVNIDGIGNRVAGMIFGPRTVIVVAGTNKIVRDVDEAINRIKNFIAPYHARTKKKKTPCAINGRCVNCKSPERICNITTIIDKKPSYTNFNIVLIDKDLGLGWDPSWPEERRDKILQAYRKSRRGFSQAAQKEPP